MTPHQKHLAPPIDGFSKLTHYLLVVDMYTEYKNTKTT